MLPLHEELHIEKPEQVPPFLIIPEQVERFCNMSKTPAFNAWLEPCFCSKNETGQGDAVFRLDVAIQLDDAVERHAFEGRERELMSQCVEPNEYKQPVHDLIADRDKDAEPGLGVFFRPFGEVLLDDIEACCRVAHERKEGSAAVEVIWRSEEGTKCWRLGENGARYLELPACTVLKVGAFDTDRVFFGRGETGA